MLSILIRITYSILSLLTFVGTVYALPSEGRAGHGSLTEKSAEIKYGQNESYTNGLRKNIDNTFGGVDGFKNALSSSSIAEDNTFGGGLGGATHFYDPDKDVGYLGIFSSAKDRALYLYNTAVDQACKGNANQDPSQLKKAWEDF